MNFERINEYLRESSNQSRFILALSLSTVMTLALAMPLAIKASGTDPQSASEQVIDLKGPSTALLDQQGNTVLVPQAVVPRSGTVASSEEPPAPESNRPARTNPAAPTASPTPAPPATTGTGGSVTVPVSPIETTTATTNPSTSKQTSTTEDDEPTTTEDTTVTTVEDTETTTDTPVSSVAPKPTLSDPPTTAASITE